MKFTDAPRITSFGHISMAGSSFVLNLEGGGEFSLCIPFVHDKDQIILTAKFKTKLFIGDYDNYNSNQCLYKLLVQT